MDRGRHGALSTKVLQGIDTDAILCLVLPDPIAHLVMRGKWTDFMLLQRWRFPGAGSALADWPPRWWVDVCRPDHRPDDAPLEAPDFSPCVLSAMCNQIRNWSNVVQAGAGPDGADGSSGDDADAKAGILAEMGGIVRTLDSWASLLQEITTSKHVDPMGVANS